MFDADGRWAGAFEKTWIGGSDDYFAIVLRVGPAQALSRPEGENEVTREERASKMQKARRRLEAALISLDDLGLHQPAAMVDHALQLLIEHQEIELRQSSSLSSRI